MDIKKLVEKADKDIYGNIEAIEKEIKRDLDWLEKNETSEDESLMIKIMTTQKRVKRLGHELREEEKRLKDLEKAATEYSNAHRLSEWAKEDMKGIQATLDGISLINYRRSNFRFVNAAKVELESMARELNARIKTFEKLQEVSVFSKGS